MKVRLLPALLAFGFAVLPAFGSEQAGPNPANLSPSGSQGVSLYTGALTYSYPIVIPPGRRGIQPGLSLLYNSQAQNGWLGLGWNLSLGSIQRSTRNGIPTYNDSQDTFILQFQGATSQLVSIATGTDSTGSYTEYRAQIESAFLRLRYYATATPSLWIATSKDGTQYQLQGLGKNTSNSKFFYWGLTEVFDPLGNFMQITYPSLSSATASGAPGPGGTPTAIYSTGAVVGFMPASISYTGKCTAVTCQTVSTSPANQITFSYELRPDTMTSAMVGGEQVLTTRLKTIQTASNGSTVRTYQLTYSTSVLGSSLLTSITFIGNDGTTSLSTTTFSYQGSATYSVTLSTSYQLPVDITQATVVDVNGDGLPDIVQNYTGVGSGAWLNTGNGWASSSTWIPPTPVFSTTQGDLGVRFADVNGDGLVDILQGEYLTFNAWLNNGSGWTSSSTWNPPVAFVDNNNLNSGSVLEDVNGDGLPDALQNLEQNIQFPPNFVTGNWLDKGNGWGPKISTWVPPSLLVEMSCSVVGACSQADWGVRFADLDGDGLVDVVGSYFLGSLSSGAWLNTGQGWTSRQSQWNPPAAFTIISNGGAGFITSQDNGLRFVDINGDGLPDLVQYSSNPVVFHIWLNTGQGWLQNDSFATSVSSISTNGHLEFADLNGDGVPDIIALSTNPASDRVYLGQSTPSNVLTTINNGLGGITQIAYAFSPPPAQPGMHLPPVTVVQSVTTSDGMAGDTPMTSSYSFSGGLFAISRPNREFLGFRQITKTDGQGNYSVSHFLQNDNAISGVNLYKGMISEQDNYDSSGNLLAQSTYTVSYSTPFAGVYFPITAETDSYVGNKHSVVKYAYDSYGNLTQEQDLGDVSVTGDERTLVTGYSASTGAYLVGYSVTKQVFSGLGTTGALLSDTSFYYDSTYSTNPTSGVLTKTDQWLSGGQDPISTTTYDVYGNVTDTYDALYNATSGAQGNHIHTVYETLFNQFPKSVQQVVGSTLNIPAEMFTYDAGIGQILSHVDVNGSTTTYSYDVFGRLSAVVGPADQVSSSSPTATYQYNVSSAPPQSVASNARVIHGTTNTLLTYTFFDGLGRKIETKTAGPAGTQIVAGAVAFNSLGQAATSYVTMSRATSTSFVIASSTLPSSLTIYDGLGRVVEVVNPDNTISTRAYQGWTETDTDANGHSKAYVKNAYGQIVEVDEQYSTSTYVTTYQYDLLGNLTSIVNSLGQGTTIYYDTLSRKTKMVDPQMGTWQYQYDPNGNLLQQTDSKNQTITMTYDPLNRRTFKIYPDSTMISYFYDSGAFAQGKLSEVIDLSGTQQFAYDSVGNVLSTTRTIGATVYVTSMTYDALGRVTSLIYPDTATVNNIYDGSFPSYVQSVNGAVTYATLSYSTSAPAKVSNVLYGNGMNAQYAYDPNMFRLTSLKTLASGATTQSLSYGYDNVGNISQITDSTGPMTQTFSYDPLDRLSQAAGPYGTNNYAYDPVGNFTLNSDNAAGFWGFDDTSNLTSTQGSVAAAPARIGNGLNFDGASQASIDGSSTISPPATMTIALWLRPKALGSGYAVSKSGSYFFPQIESDGSLDAKLELSSGEQVVHVSSGALFNLWSYFVMTYDGGKINVYVDGQLWKVQSATGTIQTSTQPIVLGTSFTGLIDELGVYPQALSASQVLQRYKLYPSLAQSQPFAPNSFPGGMTAGVVNSTYTFSFTAWDLNGNSLKYRIDWGTGAYQDTAYVPSGTTVQSTVSWTSTGTYSVRVESVEPGSGGPETVSSWSPTCNILIVSVATHTALSPPLLIGASANVGTLSGFSRVVANTVGEALTGLSSSTVNIGYLGYQGSTVAPSAWTPQYLGPQGTGGTDAPPTPVLPVSNLVTVQFSTSSVDVSTIALNLLEHGATTFIDANGNLQVQNGRWIAYDFDNRPIRTVTQDATLIQFAYDYDGNRTQQAITQLGQSSQTTTYVGGIYDTTTSTSSIKYITAGPLRVAMLDSSGTTTYFLTDHLGSTNLLVNISQSSVRSTRNMPFGGTFQTSGTTDNDHKFTGQRLDAATGLYYYGPRYYDPLLGRFLSPDTVIQNPYNPQALNRYAYCWNNPIKLLDTDGHRVLQAALTAAVLVGAAANGTLSYFQGGPSAILPGVARGAIEGAAFTAGFALGAGPAAGLAFGGAMARAVDSSLAGDSAMNVANNAALGWIFGGAAGIAPGIAGSAVSSLSRIVTNWASPNQAGPSATTATASPLGQSAAEEALTTQAAENPTTLYRAVSHAEYADMATSGVMRASPNSYEFGKFFAETGENAVQWGNSLEGAGNFRVIEAQFPSSTANQFMQWNMLDNIGPARYGTFEQIGQPTINLWEGSP